jgi:hypothetical protein
MNVNYLYFLFEENMMKCLNFRPIYLCKDPPLYFLFYFFEIPEIFPYKTADLEYVNFATPCITSLYTILHIVFTEEIRLRSKGKIPQIRNL